MEISEKEAKVSKDLQETYTEAAAELYGRVVDLINKYSLSPPMYQALVLNVYVQLLADSAIIETTLRNLRDEEANYGKQGD